MGVLYGFDSCLPGSYTGLTVRQVPCARGYLVDPVWRVSLSGARIHCTRPNRLIGPVAVNGQPVTGHKLCRASAMHVNPTRHVQCSFLQSHVLSYAS